MMIDQARLEADLREVWITVVALATSLDLLGSYAAMAGDDAGRVALWDYITTTPLPWTRLKDAELRLHRLLTLLDEQNTARLSQLRQNEQVMRYWTGPQS